MAVSYEQLTRAVEDCFQAQQDWVARWHDHEPAFAPLDPAPATVQRLRDLVKRQHQANFRLWHVEDTARRKDVGPEVIADCKYRIDTLNQQRNDLIEQVDACLVELVEPHLPPVDRDAPARYNTETIGSALDRLSIQSLKMYHMREQTERSDVEPEHVQTCRGKLSTMGEQHADLCRSVLELLDEYRQGTKRPKVYFQFKMYNDPALNPELYAPKG